MTTCYEFLIKEKEKFFASKIENTFLISLAFYRAYLSDSKNKSCLHFLYKSFIEAFHFSSLPRPSSSSALLSLDVLVQKGFGCFRKTESGAEESVSPLPSISHIGHGMTSVSSNNTGISAGHLVKSVPWVGLGRSGCSRQEGGLGMGLEE